MQFLALRAKPFSLWMMLLIFTPGALALDWIVLDGIWWQYRATGFPIAKATIARAEVVERRGSKGGRTYTLFLDYRFTVDGQIYSATRLRYYANGTSNRAAAADLQAEYPVGSVVDAYYPPDNPTDAILIPGVQGTDWLRLMLAVAANLVVAGILGLALWRRPPFDPSDPAWLTETENGWQIQLPAASRRAVFIVSFAIASLIVWLGMNIRVGENPEPIMVAAAFAGVIAVAAVLSVLLASEPVLEADLSAKELVLPAPWLGDPVRVPFGGIATVTVRSEVKSAGRNQTYEVFHCEIGWGADNRVDLTTIATFLEQSQAERLALWVKLNCGLATPEGENGNVNP